MPAPLEFPREIISDIITAAITLLRPPTTIGVHKSPTQSCRSLLLTTSLVNKMWAEESQRILFLTESSLRTQEGIRGWSLAAGRYAISSLTVTDDNRRRGTKPTTKDIINLLDTLGSNLSHLEICTSILSDAVLQHPKLSDLKSLKLSFLDVDIPSLPQILGTPQFSLDSLEIFVLLNTDSGNVNISNTLRIWKALEPTLSRTRKLSIIIVDMTGYPEEDGFAACLASMISATSGSLESLELAARHHSRINTVIKVLPVLTSFYDTAQRGRREGMTARIASLPRSLKRYDFRSDDSDYPEEEKILLNFFLEKLLEDKKFLPELEKIGILLRLLKDAGTRDLLVEAQKQRPKLKFVLSKFEQPTFRG
ncbi:hypothetical protein P7C70_g3526, partial [Phenoliferia sp. Uapishka_3]